MRDLDAKNVECQKELPSCNDGPGVGIGSTTGTSHKSYWFSQVLTDQTEEIAWKWLAMRLVKCQPTLFTNLIASQVAS